MHLWGLSYILLLRMMFKKIKLGSQVKADQPRTAVEKSRMTLPGRAGQKMQLVYMVAAESQKALQGKLKQ